MRCSDEMLPEQASQADSDGFSALAADLALCHYQLMCLAELQGTLRFRDPNEGHYDLCIVADRLSRHQKDLLILQRERLINQLNTRLMRRNSTLRFEIVVDDSTELWLTGDELQPEFEVHYLGNDRIGKVTALPKTHLYLFFPMFDMGDLAHRYEGDRRGEYWRLDGHAELAEALWPFRIDYAGRCLAIERLDNVIVSENYER